MPETRRYEPAVPTKTAFNCPHCDTLTTQTWFSGHAEPLGKGNTPHVFVLDAETEKSIAQIEDAEKRAEIAAYAKRSATGLPFLYRTNKNIDNTVENMWVSRCYECDEVAVWLGDKMIWPLKGEAPPANADLPSEVRRDYDEAGTILNASPRGAAALLRYAIQALCKFLGEPGKHLDTDIASLVRKGLDVRVQRALDIVRVIGNNAVHPGQIDMRDNRDTAEKLFRLVNLIAEKMITEQRHVDEMYLSLPEGAREAIEKRDAPKAIEGPKAKA
jgi:hypothetical protein